MSWHVEKHPDENCNIFWVNSENATHGNIATVYSGNESHANMIAAAPEMLEVLEKIIIIHGSALQDRIYMNAKVAIAKAKGQS